MTKKTARRSFFGNLLNFFSLTVKGPKGKAIKVFLDDNCVYLLLEFGNKKPLVYGLAKSDNGLDFSFENKQHGSIKEATKNFTLEDFSKFIHHTKNATGGYKVWVNHHIIWETDQIWRGKKVDFVGLVKKDGRFLSYWQHEDELWILVYPQSRLTDFIELKIKKTLLKKPFHNPLIKPNPQNSWEAFNTFNPAALFAADKVHILYRAQGHDYISTVGYASSSDGFHIDKRLDYPIYDPRKYCKNYLNPGVPNLSYISGGGYGGCEDPRITKIGDSIYMTYVDFDGFGPPRIALTSISVKDFLAHKWLWKKPVLISPPGVVDKSACLLPEKINGKYVIFHRIFPDILIDFVDDLSFGPGRYLKGQFKISPRVNKWDSRKIGAGAPPIKTEDGWLLIYQAVDDKNAHMYQVGAMLLDLKNPTKVLYRSDHPILSPTHEYENNGFKAGVVYPCGAVVINGTLFVYYGSADSYVCVATADLKNFINQLKSSLTAKLEPAKIKVDL